MSKKELKTKEVATVKEQLPAESPLALIARAIDEKIPVETMEKLMDLQERWEKNQAKKAYNLAMAAFQGECPVIKKSTPGGSTNSGKVAYHYATLDSIVEQTKELIQRHGFSYMIRTETMENGVKVTCTVTHQMGHSEATDVQVPLGTKTNVMSASQVVAAAMTFAKRYAFSNAFGIMTGDEDNDGKKMEPESVGQPGQTDTAPRSGKFDQFLKKLEKVPAGQLDSFIEKMRASTQYTDEQKNEAIAAAMELKNRK